MVSRRFARIPRGVRSVCAKKIDDALVAGRNFGVYLGACAFLLLLGSCSKAEEARDDAASAAVPADAAPAGGPPPMMAPRSLDISPYVAEVDADKDGCMSYDEWVVKAGAPLSSYDMLKNGQGCVTFDRMFNESAPGGIDANGDGQLTLAEMKEFDKKMAPLMEGKAPPPPPR